MCSLSSVHVLECPTESSEEVWIDNGLSGLSRRCLGHAGSGLRSSFFFRLGRRLRGLLLWDLRGVFKLLNFRHFL